MIPLSTQSVISHLNCGNSKSWLLNLNLTYCTLWTEAESGLLISMLEKFSLFHLTSLLGCLDCPSVLNWNGALTLSALLNLPPKNWSLDFFYEVSFSRSCCLSI